MLLARCWEWPYARNCFTVVMASALAVGQALASSNCPPRYTATWVPGPDCGILGFGYLYGWGGNENGLLCGSYACPGGQDQAFISNDGSTLSPLEMPEGTYWSGAFTANTLNQIGGEFEGSGSGHRAFLFDGKSFLDLGTLPGHNWSEFGGLNSDGVVVGMSMNVVTGPFASAVRWIDRSIRDISADFPIEGDSRALAVSNNGLITGYMGWNSSTPNHHAYIWSDGQVFDLGVPFPNCTATDGRSINSKGHVCGVWRKSISSQPFFVQRSFFFDGEQMVDLGSYLLWPDLIVHDLNESDQVVGFAGAGGVPGWAVLWQDGMFYRLDDLIIQGEVPVEMMAAMEITNDGQIFGYGKVPGFGSQEAIRLTPIPPRSGDVNCDFAVDVDDLLGVINAWGECEKGQSCQADLNEDHVVNLSDLTIVIDDWGK